MSYRHCSFVQLLVLLSCFIFVTIVKSHNTCTSLKNVIALVRDTMDREFNKTLDGCLERLAFVNDNNATVTHASIRNQKIPKLGKDSVKNMVRLKTVSFWECQLDSIEPGAFKNVPRLRTVQISYCNLKEIPKGVFNVMPKLEVIRIHNNQIDIVEDHSFANLSSLKKVYGSSNELTYWNREWFSNTTNLEVMDFSFNHIRTIPPHAFASLSKLRQVFFDYNEISVIHEDAFQGISYLDYLGLRHNRLAQINEKIFPNEIKIKSFFFDANYLNFIADEVLKKVLVKEVTIDNNPWKCPCLDRIHYWLFSTKGAAKRAQPCGGPHVPVCAYSTVFSQTCLEHVDKELTERYIETLRNLEKPLDRYCARLD